MAGSSRDITLDVTIKARTDDALKASRALSDVEREAARSGASLKGMSQESSLLDAQIEKSTTRLRELEKVLAEVGDDKQVRQAIRSERSWLSELEKTAKDLKPVAQEAGQNFFSSFSDTLKSNLPGLIPVLVGAAVVAAPLLGAIVAGAVTGVAGIGGVAGGIFAASKDPAVRAAASELGKHITSEFFGSGDSFVEPILRSVHILEASFDDLNLAKTFELAAPYVTEFAGGLGDLATQFMPGFNKALKDGKPAIDLFAARLPEIGRDLGNLFAKLADSKGTLEGVNALFNTISNTIVIVGTSLAWLGDQFHNFDVAGKNTATWLAGFFDKIGAHGTADDLKGIADGLSGLNDVAGQSAIHFRFAGDATKYLGTAQAETADETKALADEFKRLDDAARKYFNLTMSLDQADQAVAQSFLDLSENLKKGKGNWGENTQAGLDNIKMVQSSIQTLEQQREAAIDAANGDKAAIDKANAAYEAQFQKILAVAKAAGDGQAALKALAGEYDINVVVTATDIASGLKGLGSLGKVASAYLQSLLPHRAAGGPVMAGQSYRVGEQGEETFTPAVPGYITPHGAMSSSGGTNLTLNVGGQPSGALERLFLDWLQTALAEALRQKGGSLSLLNLKPA